MRLIRTLLRFIADDRGVGSIWMLSLLPLFLVLAGLGMDGTAAFRTRDMLQSTADASALAGALALPTAGAATAAQETNAAASARTYSQANMSVAGFGNVLNLNATTNGDIQFGNWNGTTFTSPAGVGQSENAIEVTVRTAAANSNAYPTTFLALIGKSSWDIAATAIAINGVPKPVCIFGLHSFLVDGGGSADLHGCVLAVNGTMTCNNSVGVHASFAISTADSPGQAKGCGTKNLYDQAPTIDPYAALASNIPANPCGNTAASFPQEGGSLPASNKWSGSKSASDMASPICGDLQLTGNVTITNDATLVIENGNFDTGNFSITTASGASLTIIFTGPTISGFSPGHTVIGSSSGTLNISAPSSGTWRQMLIYQDPAITCSPLPCSSTAITEGGQGAGSGPVWNISGIVYLPHAFFQIKGLVSPASSAPNACFTLIAYDIEVRGTGQILAEPACTNAPTVLVPISRLVE
jgi:Flp pilus assembly protein TadG